MPGDDGLMVLVKHLLRRKGMTQRDLAARLGISPQALNQVLTRNRPGTKHMQAMAEILGIPVERLTASGTVSRTGEEMPSYTSELPVAGEVGLRHGWSRRDGGHLRFHEQLVALRIADDLGAPLLQVGQWIVIDQGRQAWDGDLVLVVAADGSCSIRRYVEAATGPALIAIDFGRSVSALLPEDGCRVHPIVVTADPSAVDYEA